MSNFSVIQFHLFYTYICVYINFLLTTCTNVSLHVNAELYFLLKKKKCHVFQLCFCRYELCVGFLAVCEHAYTYANVRYAVKHAVMHVCATCMRKVLAKHSASLHPPSAYHCACVFRSMCQNAMSFGCVSAVMNYA